MSTHAKRRKAVKRQLARENRVQPSTRAMEARNRRAARKLHEAEVTAQALARSNQQQIKSFRNGPDRAWKPVVFDIMKNMSKDQSERFVDLLTSIEERTPKLIGTPGLERFRRLVLAPWIRDVKEWEPRGKGETGIFRSLVEHLFCKFRVPLFLYTAFDRTGTLVERFIDLVALVGRGESVAKAFEAGVLPTPLTKKMVHEFMQTEAGTDIIHAIRRAQVKVSGGDSRLARALCHTPLGRAFMGDEKFWASVIQWFCGQAMIEPTHIGPMIDYLTDQQRQNMNYSMKGRTAASILKAMKDWHHELNQARAWGGWKPVSDKFKPSGFEGAKWETKYLEPKTGHKVEVKWFVEEISTLKDLQEEGRAMKHCVYSYGPRIEAGSTSVWRIWKIENGVGNRCLTVEVNNGIRTVVQARGICNRSPEPREERVLLQWAQTAGLQVSVGRW